MNKKKLLEYFDLAKKSALTAGNFLSKNKKITVNSNKGKDIKISSDKKSEEIIINILKKTKLPILSEESGFVNKAKGDLVWIIDPLDGSLNFFRGLPLNCVSIALWRKGKPLLGVIYDFNKKEIFSGIVGENAWLNNKKIHVSREKKKENAILTTGFSSYTNFSSIAITNYVKQIKSFKKIRLFGSAALSLAYVACGRVDAYLEKDIKIWDVAAGLAIVMAAGGKYDIKKSLSGNYTYHIQASNNYLKKI